MVIEIGDVIACRKKVESISSLYPHLKEGDIGIVIDTAPEFNNLKVYGVVISGQTYYLFQDEIEKIETEKN